MADGRGSDRSSLNAVRRAAVQRRNVADAIERLWGRPLPDDDCGRDCLRLLLQFAAHSGGRLTSEGVISAWAPWMAEDETSQLAAEAAASGPPIYSPDDLAQRIGVTMAVRQQLGLTMVGAIDCAGPDARKAAKKERRKLAARARRKTARDREALTRHRNEAAGFGHELPARAAAIKTALSGQSWVGNNDIAAIVRGWASFAGLAGRSLHRVINREVDRLRGHNLVETKLVPRHSPALPSQGSSLPKRPLLSMKRLVKLIANDVGATPVTSGQSRDTAA